MNLKKGFVYINGKEFPAPMRDGLKITHTTFVNAGRTANAKVVGEPIGRTQYKLELKWGGLDGETWASMLQEFDKFAVNVTFFDPMINNFISIMMYVGDRTSIPYFVDPNTEKVTMYETCSCNLIDLGW